MNSDIFHFLDNLIIAFVRKHYVQRYYRYLDLSNDCQVGVGCHGSAHCVCCAAAASATVPAEKKCAAQKATLFF